MEKRSKINTGNAFMFFLMLYYLFFAILIMPIALGVLVGMGHEQNAVISSPFFLIFSQVFGLLLPLIIWTLIRGEKPGTFLKNQPLGGKNIVFIVLLSFFMQPAMMFISGLMSFLFPNPVPEMLGGFGGHPIWIMLLAAAVTPGIVEELVFRGYIQTKQEPYGVHKAAIVNGLFFGIIHLNPHQFLYAFAMGIMFYYMVHYTRSVWAGVLSHFLMNATQVSMAYFAMGIDLYEDMNAYAINQTEELLASINLSEAALAVIFIAVFAVIATPIAIVVFKIFITHNKQRNASMYDAADVPQNDVRHENPMSIFDKNIAEPDTTTVIQDEVQTNNTVLQTKRLSIIDPFFIAIVVLFILFMIVINVL